MYKITKYSYDQAKKLGVEIKSSSNSKKKIDVFKNGVKIASIGARNYSDYPSYIQIEGKQYAESRRRLYRLRHKGEEKVIGSNGFYAWYILW